jgi:hypothetical protein
MSLPTFLANEEAFAECVAFWRGLFFELASAIPSPTDWRVGYGDGPSDGDPRASAPIEDRITFEGYSPALRRLLQIYQGPASSAAETDLISIALKEMSLPPEGAPAVLVLLVSLVLSEATVDVAREAISTFMNPDCSAERLFSQYPNR